MFPILYYHHLNVTPFDTSFPPIQAFDDCTTIGMTFKLLESFEGLLDREVIATDLEKKNADLLVRSQFSLPWT